MALFSYQTDEKRECTVVYLLLYYSSHSRKEREREREASVCLWLEGRLEAENKDFLAREEEKG